MKESHPFFCLYVCYYFFLEYDVSFTCFSVRFDCAFIFFFNGHFGQCVWDGEWEGVSGQFQTSF